VAVMKRTADALPESISPLLQDFQVRDLQQVASKISRFKSFGPDRLHAVLDFDHTLTAGKKLGQNVGTWDVLDAFIPEEGRQKHDEIYRSHRSRELAGELGEAEAIAWWSETLDLICSYRPDIRGAEKSFLEIAKLRDGGRELFDACILAGVLTIVLSAGVRQITEILVQHYGLHPSLILSTDLIMDTAGHAVGWKRDSLIHMLNKREMGHAELLDMRAKRDNVMLVGDVPDDARMVLGDESVIRIRVIDPRKGEHYDPAEVLKTSFEAGFDLVVDHSLQPIAKLMQWICTES
jgi:phosphoserine phosphatase